MYSLIATCKLNEVDPNAWLASVLDRVANHSALELDQLPPGIGERYRPSNKPLSPPS